MRKVAVARQEKLAEIQQQFPDGNGDLSVLTQYTETVRKANGVPYWFREAYPKIEDFKKAMTPVIEEQKRLRTAEQKN